MARLASADAILDSSLRTVVCELTDVGIPEQFFPKADVVHGKGKVQMMRQVEHVLNTLEPCEEREQNLKAQLTDCKMWVQSEEARCCSNAARLHQEIASLPENQPSGEVEVDRYLNMEESVNVELGNVLEAIASLESQISYHDSTIAVDTLEELTKEVQELEAEVAFLKKAENETIEYENGKDIKCLESMVTCLRKDSCWNCGVVLEEAGQDKLSVKLITHMDKGGAGRAHELKIGLNFSHGGDLPQANITEAVLCPADITSDELSRKVESASIAGDGFNRLEYFVQSVARCLFWSLPRQTALEDVRTKYSLRGLNAECSQFRCTLPCGIEVEVGIPLLWPNDKLSHLALLGAQAPVLDVDLGLAVANFSDKKIDANISLDGFLMSLDSWLRDYIENLTS